MARAWRIEYEGAFYHLLSRGNERGDIFVDDNDRHMFLDTVGEMSERFDIDIFAYVLMDNHYHLLVRTQRANLTRAMQWFGATYSSRFNYRHARSGHLFQGRYKSIVVQNDAYVMQLSCYIHRNPLRAGIIKRLADYPWSSYREKMGSHLNYLLLKKKGNVRHKSIFGFPIIDSEKPLFSYWLAGWPVCSMKSLTKQQDLCSMFLTMKGAFC